MYISEMIRPFEGKKKSDKHFMLLYIYMTDILTKNIFTKYNSKKLQIYMTTEVEHNHIYIHIEVLIININT